MGWIEEGRRIKVSLAILWLVTLAGLLFFGGRILMARADSSMHELRVSLSGDEIRFVSSSDGPFVIFGVGSQIVTGPKKVATFAQPLIFVDSHGVAVRVNDLKWLDERGQPTTAPEPGTLSPIYIRPERRQ